MTTLIRQRCYREVGLYDENLPWEDWDMWLRIARSYSFVYSPIPSAKYRYHEKSLSHSDQARMLKESINIGMKQFGLEHLKKIRSHSSSERCSNTRWSFISRDGERSASILLAVWQTTKDEGLARCIGLQGVGFRSEVGSERTTTRYYPFAILASRLNATRPVRHALGLRKKSSDHQ